jgi:hypothetical protein
MVFSEEQKFIIETIGNAGKFGIYESLLWQKFYRSFPDGKYVSNKPGYCFRKACLPLQNLHIIKRKDYEWHLGDPVSIVKSRILIHSTP